MKKLWLILAGAAALLLVAFAGAETAKADEHYGGDHCICGGVETCLKSTETYGHQGNAAQGKTLVTSWEGVGTVSQIQSKLKTARDAYVANGKTAMVDVYLYLTADITYSGSGNLISSSVYNGVNIFLCLNGHTIKNTSTSRIFLCSQKGPKVNDVEVDSDLMMGLTLCDCKGGGKLTRAEGDDRPGIKQQGDHIMMNSGSNYTNLVVIYNVEISNGKSGTNTKDSRHSGCIGLAGYTECYQYGGVIKNGTCVTNYAGNIGVTGNSKYFLYDGTITGGTSKTAGGNVYIAAGGEFTMYGGTVSNGTATSSNGGNFAVFGKLFLNGGIVEGGEANAGSNIRVEESGEVTIGGETKILGGENHMKSGATDQNDGSSYANGNVISNLGKVTINGGYLECRHRFNVGVVTSGGGKFVINGGVFTKTGESSRLFQGVGGGSLTINGGLFIGVNIETYISTVTINGGVFTGAITQAGASASSVGVLMVTGGYYVTAPYNSNYSNQRILGVLKETADASPVAGKTYYTKTEQTNGPEKWYQYMLQSNLTEFAAGKTYVELDPDTQTQAKDFNYTLSYKTWDGQTASVTTTKAIIPVASPIENAALIVGEKLNVVIGTNAGYDGMLPHLENAVMGFTLGTDEEVLGQWNETTRRFEFSDITADRMEETINATLYAVGSDETRYPLYSAPEFSIADYLDFLEDEYEEVEELMAVTTNLRYYGAATAYQFAESSEEREAALEKLEALTFGDEEKAAVLSDTDIQTQIAAFNESLAAYSNRESANGQTYGYFASANVQHLDDVKLRVFFRTTGESELTFKIDDGTGERIVTGTAHPEGEGYYLYTDGIKANEYAKEFTFKAYSGDTCVSQIVYSVDTYCARRVEKGDKLAYVLYQYGLSAAAYTE